MIFALLAIFPLLTAALYSAGDAVITLSSRNFDKEVTDSESVWIVEFFAPWCGHCQRLAPDYKKAAKNAQGIVKIGAVNCDEEQSICGRFGIKGFPTIKLFPGDRTGSKKFPIDYNGARSAKAIVDAGIDRLPSKYVERISDKNPIDAFYAKENASLPKAILFTDKPKTAPLYKALSLEFKDRMVFGEVRHSVKSLVEEFGIEKFPTLIVIPTGDEEPVKYKGNLKPDLLTEFLEKYAKPLSKSSSKAKGSSKKQEPVEEEPFDPNIPQIEDQTDYEKYCVAASEKGLSSVCFIVFLPPVEEEYPESVQQHGDTITMLQALKEDLHQLRQKSPSSVSNVFMSWSFGHTQLVQNIMHKFGVSTDMPSALALNPGKKGFRPYIGAFDKDGMKHFLTESVRRGLYKFDWDVVFGQEKEKRLDESSCGSDDAEKEGTCTGPSDPMKIQAKDKAPAKNHDEL